MQIWEAVLLPVPVICITVVLTPVLYLPHHIVDCYYRSHWEHYLYSACPTHLHFLMDILPTYLPGPSPDFILFHAVCVVF